MNKVRSKINYVIFKKFTSNKNNITKRGDIHAGLDFTDDLNMDSLDFIEMIMALEAIFETDIADEEAYEWKKVGDIYKYFQKRT